MSDTTFLSFDEVENDTGLYRLVFTPTELGSYDISIIATDVDKSNLSGGATSPINKTFLIRAKHSFFVDENLKPVANSGYKMIQASFSRDTKTLTITNCR